MTFTYGVEHKTFNSWRAFILVCSIPVWLAIVGLILMPESPRFLLQVGRDLEALAIYRRLYLWNHPQPGAAYEVSHPQPCAAYEVGHPQPGAAYEVSHLQPSAAYEVSHPQSGAAYEVRRETVAWCFQAASDRRLLLISQALMFLFAATDA